MRERERDRERERQRERERVSGRARESEREREREGERERARETERERGSDFGHLSIADLVYLARARRIAVNREPFRSTPRLGISMFAAPVTCEVCY